MKKILPFITILLFHFFLPPIAGAQTNQTVANGMATMAVTFPGTGCVYNWVNNTPGIGLAASGTGNIPSFTAVNTGSAPVTATITATPVLSANNGYLYVTNTSSKTVSVVNPATNSVVATIPVSLDPDGVVLSPDGSKVYVLNGMVGSGSISVINAATNTVTATINAGSTGSGGAMAVSPDNTLLYIANYNSNSISVISTISNAITATIPVGNGPSGVTISPDGSRIYVVNAVSGTVSVINTTTNAVVSTITLGTGAAGSNGYLTLSPDGSRLYVSNSIPQTIYEINTTNNTVIASKFFSGSPFGIAVTSDGSKLYFATSANTVVILNAATLAILTDIVVGSAPRNISISPDNSRLYVVNSLSNNVSVANLSTNTIIATINVGSSPDAISNFIVSTGCVPSTFTITVTPTPNIITTTASGTITACAGTASSSPNIQQFTASGNNLATDITATAPVGFEISLIPGSGFGNSVIIPQSGGAVSSTIVYVRSAASASAGSLSGNVVLTSGAATQNVAVKGTVNALPTVNTVISQTVVNGNATAAINFTGTGNAFTWVSDTPGIGLAASGTGNIPPFTAINGGITPVTATVTVTPVSTAGCTGTPATFTITVNPSPVINTIGSVYALNTTYGTPSTTNSFTLSGTNLMAGVVVDPPVGFEVSTDDITFSKTLTAGGAGIIVSTPVYIRLAATTNAGNYSGSIVLSSPGGANVSVNIGNSTVSPAPLAIVASDISKPYGTALASGISSTAFSAIGLKNGETVAGITETFGPGSAAGDPGGIYAASVIPSAATGGTFKASNYNITYLLGEIIVGQVPLTIAADNQKKIFGAVNPFLTVTYSGFVNHDGPANLTSQPVVSTTAMTNSPIGTYPIDASGASSPNYTFIYVPGTLTVEPGTIVVPNAFTPNGDGINDTWDIRYIENYPNSTVQIFNRYGQNLFYSINYPIAWAGKYNGTDLPVGTYYYIINLNNGLKPVSGWVAIIR